MIKRLTRKELIKKYLDFFKSKSHKIIPSSSLIPENDPSVLFTTAGMHPLVPFLMGQKHPLGKRLVDVQKCIRTTDIEKVGNETHNTFFEMLGNWSLGDYFKEEAIKLTFEFHNKILKIPLERYAVTVFEGNKDSPKDEESVKVWLSLGIQKERIALLPKEDNWWELAGPGPCGPCTEMFFWKDNQVSPPKKFDTNDKRWVEIGNDVLMTYIKNEKGSYSPAKQKNIDFGGGVERTLAVLNGFDDIYLTDIFQPIIKEIEKISKKEYKGNEKEMRIIADHIRAATFILGDEKAIKPSNVEQGYILRRLIRRAIRYGKKLDINGRFTSKIAEAVIRNFDDYAELDKNKKFIISQLDEEESRFNQTLEKGLKEFERITKDKKKIDGKDAFLLFQSFGFPIEMTKELAEENNLKVDLKAYEDEFKKHQELSRTASVGMFKSGLGDVSEDTTKLHTATHLLNEALRKVVSKDIKQRGSNITPERLRFDFNYDKKLTDEQLKKVEAEVNNVIKKAIPIERMEMTVADAIKQGAQAMFTEKYAGKVSVYKIGDYSIEICAGPHVKNTKELGKFKITKEEAVAAGIRRIKAVLE